MTYTGDPIAEKLDKLAEATGAGAPAQVAGARPDALPRSAVDPAGIGRGGHGRADRLGRPCRRLDRLGRMDGNLHVPAVRVHATPEPLEDEEE